VDKETIHNIDNRLSQTFKRLPIQAELVVKGKDISGFTSDRCLIIRNIYQTGILSFLKSREENNTCQSCPVYKNCSLNSAIFAPIKVQNQVKSILLVTPQKKSQNWLNNTKEIIEQLTLLSSKWISTDFENEDLSRENDIFRNEVKGLFLFMKDSVLIVGMDGIIHNVSESVSLELKRKRSALIGEKITDLISDSDWTKIKEMNENNEMNMAVVVNENQNKQTNWTVKIQPIYHLGKKESFLMYLQAIKSSKRDISADRILYSFDDVKGVSEEIISVIELGKRVAPSNTSVLLRGESGTGKEVFAQSIHQASPRKNGPFIAINCAAIPETLLESELFGYVKGAFTNAQMDKPGRFELANGGTIFLDEIGDMSLHLQAKLLRVVQERKIERVGDTRSIPVDVRILTATHRQLEDLVSNGQFREDLYYRLNVIPITIPPLKKRKEDIPILVEYFMKALSQQLHRAPKRLSSEAYHLLLDYHWPGNVRELQNVVHHFIQLEIGDIVTKESLPRYLVERSSDIQEMKKENHPTSPPKNNSRFKDDIIHLLDQHGRDTDGKKKVAAQLGISLPTLYRKLKRLNIR
jgi:transcriptional regulator with PAS, ATPase and Fis domain